MSSGRSRARFLSGETRDRPRFANRSPVTPISGAACVELSTPRGGFDLAGGNADARRGAAENSEESSAQCAPAVEEALFRETRVGGVSREKARGRGSRSASRRHPRAWAVRPDLARVAHPFRWMSNPRVARTPRQAARGRWDSRRISAADLSAGLSTREDVARVVDARRVRHPCRSRGETRV